MADPKATPISALPRGPSSQGEDDQQFIQNILKQMKDDNQESEQSYQQTQQAYNNQQFGVNPAEQHQMNQKQIQEMQQQQYNQPDEQQYENEKQYAYPEEVPLTLFEKIKRDVKAPLLFLVLYFVLCLPMVRTFGATQLARFTQNANYQLYGSSLLLGLVGAVIFYLVSRFVL